MSLKTAQVKILKSLNDNKAALVYFCMLFLSIVVLKKMQMKEFLLYDNVEKLTKKILKNISYMNNYIFFILFTLTLTVFEIIYHKKKIRSLESNMALTLVLHV